MQKILQNALKETGIPSYFISKKNNISFPSIVYSINEKTMDNSEDEEETMEYEIYINLYSKNTLIQDKENIKNTLSRDKGFYKSLIGIATYDEDLDCYVQSFQYKSFITK